MIKAMTSENKQGKTSQKPISLYIETAKPECQTNQQYTKSSGKHHK